jgi:DNA-binding NarL/FixJ family response regulator
MSKGMVRVTNGGERGAGEVEGGLRGRVLVVDDDQVDRMAVRRLLADASDEVTVEEADGVLAAIEALAAAPFDCVVLDYNLPDGDGLTFLRGLRTAGLTVPVVILTGQDDDEVARDLMEAGAAAYLPKARSGSEILRATVAAAIRTGPSGGTGA